MKADPRTAQKQGSSGNKERLRQAAALRESGRRVEAVAAVREVLASAPDDIASLQLAARLALELEDQPEALRFLQRLAELQPAVPELRYSIGNLLARMNRPAEAAEALRAALRLQPRFAKAAFNLAVLLETLGRRQEALAVYDDLLAHQPDHLEALSNRGRLLRQAGRLNEALASYRRALARRPDHPVLLYNCGLAWRHVQRFPEAIDCFTRALAARPAFVEALLELGHSQRASGRPEEAADSYRRYLELRPNSAPALACLGDCLLEQGQADLALAKFGEALALDAGLAEAALGRAAALLEQGRSGEAIGVLRSVLRDRPDSLAAVNRLRDALRREGRLVEAVPNYQALLAGPAPPARAFQALAEVHMELGDKSAAREVCEACLERHRGDTRSLAYLAHLRGELDDVAGQGRLLDDRRFLREQELAVPPRFTDRPAFHEAFADHILTHPTLTYEMPGTSTVGGRHSGELLIEPKGPVADFETMVGRAITAYMADLPEDPAHPFVAARPARWTLNIWSVVLGAAAHQKPHIHASAWLSGVYYLRVPAVVSAGANDHAGWLEFFRPSERVPVARPPAPRLVRPREGLLVLFPSYFYHRTVPFESDELRISIAFDVLPYAAA